MREFTKSIISFSWAVSLLGVKEATRLLQPRGQSPEVLSKACEPVTQATVAQLEPPLQSIFRTGDHFQRAIVNTVFGVFNPASWSFIGARSVVADTANRNPVGPGQGGSLRQDSSSFPSYSDQKAPDIGK